MIDTVHLRLASYLKGIRKTLGGPTRTRSARPRCEQLEDRSVPATFVVTTLSDFTAGSLRSAIDSANKAVGRDTIVFDPSLDGDIFLQQASLDVTDDLDLVGPAAATGRQIRINGIPPPGNGFGPLLRSIVAGVDLTISDMVFQNNKHDTGTGPGGIQSGSLTLTNVTVQNCVSTSGATVAGSVGGVFATDALTLTNTRILNNSGPVSGGVFVQGPVLNVVNSLVSGNKATGPGNAVAGGITYFAVSGKATVSNTTISNNVGGASGGGISVGGTGTVTVNKSTISNNVQSMLLPGLVPGGGGISIGVVSAQPVEINDSVIQGNVAAGEGGGILSSSPLIIRRSQIDQNKAAQAGGGLSHFSSQNVAPLTIINSSFTANASGDNGGGIAARQSDVTFSGVTVSRNTSLEGGGVSVRGITAPVAVVIDQGSLFDSNTAGGAGGGLEVSNASAVTVSNAKVRGNLAATGGGVFLNDAGTATFTDTVIGDTVVGGNSAVDGRGGGIAADAGTTNLTLTRVSVAKNSATIGGGGLSHGGGTQSKLTVNSSSFVGNTAQFFGGGLNVRDISAINDSTIEGNTATDNQNPLNGVGAGVFADGGTLTVRRTRIALNADGSGAGGLFVNVGTAATVVESTIENNKSFSGAGGILNAGSLTVDRSLIRGNKAGDPAAQSPGGVGGGIDSSGSPNAVLRVTNSTISGNSAFQGGGILSNQNQQFELVNVTVFGNTVYVDPTQGGGLFVIAGQGNPPSLLNTIVAGNKGGATGTPSDIRGTLLANFSLIGNSANFTAAPGSGNNLLDVNAKLAPLADNGGLTLTHALQLGSPAVGAGTPTGAPPVDQRGVPRPAGGPTDIGAFQSQFPVANPDGFTTPARQTLTVAAPGVLTNDVSLSGAPLVAQLVAAPAASQGTVTLNPNGSFTFTPAAAFVGVATFTYRVSDGQETSLPATVTITVTNQPPVAVPDSFTTMAGQPLTVSAPGLLTNDSDPEGGPLQAQLGTPPLAEQGTVTLNPDGSFTFTPFVQGPLAFSGVATFTYRVSDGINTSSPVTVSITVTNQVPVAVNDSYSTPAGPGVRFLTPSILANDFDPDNGPFPLRFNLDFTPPTSELEAFVVFPDGTIGVTPAAGFVGTTTFTYRLFDGADFSALATGTITVTNETPIGQPDAFSVQAGQTLTIAGPGVLSNDSDPDGNPLQAVNVTQPEAGGSVALNADGSFTFTPAAGFVGTTTFTYQVTDGIATSAPVVVTVTVNPIVTTAVIGGQVFSDTNNNGVRDSTAGSAPPINMAPPGDVVLTRNDDGSTDKLDFGFSFDFFGKSYTQFFLNNNGNITFDQPLSQFTPDGFPQSLPIVAPFWADVDTRGELSAEVRLTRGTSPRGNPFVQIDWAGVGYFASHDDLLNDFTLYIEDDAAGDIVAFIYRDMQWTTGDASDGVGGFGGSGAQIGFDTGTGTNFQNLGRPDSDAALAPFRNTRFVFRIDASGTPQLFSEPGLDGRTIELVGADGTVAATAVSKSVDLDGNGTINPITEQGLYRFDNLPPGTYTVRLRQESGFTQTLPASGGVYNLEVIAGDESLGNLFGVFKATGPRQQLLAVGAAAGGSPRVRVFNADGSERFSFIALDGDTTFSGGIRVAVGDVTGDGVDDIIIGAGTGGGPRVEVYDGVTGGRIANFFAYEPSFRGGVHVAAADVDGDGLADVLTGAGSTGDPRLRVFSGVLVPTFDGLASQSVHDFYAFPTDLIGGVRVAAGDLDGDGVAEIVAAAGPSGDTEVRVYDGRTGALVSAFAAFTPGFRGGLFVGVIAAQGEGRGSIVVSKDSVTDYDGSVFSNLFPGLPPEALLSPPAVAVFDFTPGLGGQPAPQATLSPYEPTFLEGVRTTGGIVVSGTSAGTPDEVGFITAPGAGGDSLIRFFRYRNGVPELVRELQAFEPAFLGGVYVGASSR